MKPFLLLSLGLLSLPVASPARDMMDYVAVAEQTDRGAALAPVSPDHPVTYVARDGGYIEAGDAIAGVKPPTPEAVAQGLRLALATQGYRPAADGAAPSLLLTYHWGLIRPVRYAMYDSYLHATNGTRLPFEESPRLRQDSTLKARIALVAPTDLARDTRDRFVGINHVTTGVYVTGPMRDTLQVALYSRYFVIVTAYDYAALAQGETTTLWRVRLSAADNAANADQAVPTLAAATGLYLGRALRRAETGRISFFTADPAGTPAPFAPTAENAPVRTLIDKLLAREHAAFSGEPGADYDDFKPASPARTAFTLPPELARRVAAYQQEKAALQAALADRLKDRASGDDTRRAIDAFNTENAGRIAALARTRETLRDDLARVATARGGAADKSLDALLREFAADARDLNAPATARP